MLLLNNFVYIEVNDSYLCFKDRQWVGYDDIGMIRKKSEYIRENGFAGGMVWALDLDDFQNR